jgi:adenine deaminase
MSKSYELSAWCQHWCFRCTLDCAVASMVAHAGHYMIVVGTSKSDMALATNDVTSFEKVDLLVGA